MDRDLYSDWDPPVEDSEIARFDGGYGRTGVIRLETGTCAKCGQLKTVISMDQSEEEYKKGCICMHCIADAFDHKEPSR